MKVNASSAAEKLLKFASCTEDESAHYREVRPHAEINAHEDELNNSLSMLDLSGSVKIDWDAPIQNIENQVHVDDQQMQDEEMSDEEVEMTT